MDEALFNADLCQGAAADEISLALALLRGKEQENESVPLRSSAVSSGIGGSEGTEGLLDSLLGFSSSCLGNPSAEQEPSLLYASSQGVFPLRSLYGASLVAGEYTLLLASEPQRTLAFSEVAYGYCPVRPILDEDDDALTQQEAQQTFLNVQYATAVGAPTEVSFRERRKLALWALFDRVWFQFFESDFSLTRDMSYWY